jgi:hypothetical protein
MLRWGRPLPAAALTEGGRLQWPMATYSGIYSKVGHDEPGLAGLFRQFFYPGGLPSHDAPRDARLHQ